jgi:DNA-binding transcriptional ArsR family regulator
MDELIVRLMRTLACEERLRILSWLTIEGEQSPSRLARDLELLDTAVSGHLARLTAVGMIQRRRSGGWFYCTATSPYAANTLSGMTSAWLRKLLASPQKTHKDLGLQELRNGSARESETHLHRLIFEAATAFTDLRRLQILRRLLRKGEANLETLYQELKMSPAAALRQTDKLVRRGFVCREASGDDTVFRLARKCKTPIHTGLWEVVRSSWKTAEFRTS